MSAIDRQRDHLLSRLVPVVDALGFEIDDVTVTRVGRRHLVRIVVDGDAGIDLDGIARVSRALDTALDADDPFDSPFVLEVSSPGVDRPLTEPRHWRRNVGRLVQVELDGTQVTGRIAAADEKAVTLATDGGPVEASWDRLGRGRVQVEFNRTADRETVDAVDADRVGG